MILAKYHSSGDSALVAVCDSNLVGKKFEEGDFQIDLTGGYFKGEKVSDDELVDMLTGASNATFVGKESVEIGKKLKMIGDNVKVIDGVPVAHCVVVH